MTQEELENIMTKRYKKGKIYNLRKILLGKSTTNRREDTIDLLSICVFMGKSGGLFQFKNVRGGFTTTLSAAQLIERTTYKKELI